MQGTFRCVHLTRIRPGQLDLVNARLTSYAPDEDELGRLGIRSLQMFTTTETAPDGLVVAVLEGVDEDSVLRFLEANESKNSSLIDDLYEPHDHEPVVSAPLRYEFG